MRNNNPLNIIKSEKINWQGEVKHTGLSPDQQLPPMKEETKVMWCDIVLAMATMECGLTVKQQEELVPFIARGWDYVG